MKRIKVHLKDRSYDILIGRGLLKSLGAILKRLDIGKDAVCITNSSLLNLYKPALARSLKKGGYSVRFETIPDSERAKSIGVAVNLINKIACYDKRKKIFIINFGGGVVGDLAGFVASVYKRGIPYIQIPTTLLAQVDSAIGGKVAIDLPVAKNLVGAFYQPRLVLSDVELLSSLPERQIRNGLAEVVKYGIIKDARLFKFLEKNYGKLLRYDKASLEHVILASSRIKAGIVEKDEYDKTGERAVLNFGHTIGHAIESASKYDGKYNHGEAIAVGMVAATKISLSLGLIRMKDAVRIIDLIAKLKLPVSCAGESLKSIYDAHLHDKKFIHGKNRFVLPVHIGETRIIENIPDSVITKVLKEEIL